MDGLEEEEHKDPSQHREEEAPECWKEGKQTKSEEGEGLSNETTYRGLYEYMCKLKIYSL